MDKKEKSISIFKSYLSLQTDYRGGKSKKEVGANDRKVYKLSSNENLLGSSPKAKKVLKEGIDKLNEYSDYSDDRLRIALSEYYKGDLAPEQFITGNGGVEIIEMIVRGFVEPGNEVIISNPCFGPYNMFSLKAGAKVHDVRLSDDNYELDIDGIHSKINDNTRLIFLTSPNNPTGTIISKHEMEIFMAGIPDHVVVVLDEVYFHFTDAAGYFIASKYVKEDRRIIGVNSFSKAYGLAGLRLGYAYSTLELANYLRNLARPFMLNSLSTDAAIAALGDDAHLKRTINLIQKEKPFLYQNLDRIGLKYWKTQANFILTKPTMDADLFVEKMLKNGVMVRPVANFGAPGCVRVTIGTHVANAAFISALEIVMKGDK